MVPAYEVLDYLTRQENQQQHSLEGGYRHTEHHPTFWHLQCPHINFMYKYGINESFYVFHACQP